MRPAAPLPAGDTTTGDASARDARSGLATYRREDVVAQYAGATDLQPVEAHLFAKHIPARARILDLGVGGGRTTPCLSRGAASYVGVDYSPEMIDACRRRFPATNFSCHDAADLSAYPSGSFDVVVFSYNGIDHLFPDTARIRCHAEVARVLAAGGRFIFSAHNARGLLLRPSRSDRSLAATLKAIGAAAAANVDRIGRRLASAGFWNGSGYVRHRAHGNDRIHVTTPAAVSDELARSGLALVEHHGECYPRRLPLVVSRWIYYVALKPDLAAECDGARAGA